MDGLYSSDSEIIIQSWQTEIKCCEGPVDNKEEKSSLEVTKNLF